MEYNFASQSLGLGSILNCREFGGYVLPDGRVIKKGLLMRGGAFHHASDEDLAVLRDRYSLAVDFDFRTEQELAIAPDNVPDGVKYVWLPAIDPETEKVAGMSLPQEAYQNLVEWLVANSDNPMVQSVASRLYTDMVVNEYTQLQYAAFLQTIVNTPEGAIYWHCSQGKDRTGLGAAFLLCALGADRELIMKDYIISYEFYKDLVESIYPRVPTEAGRKVIQTFIAVCPEYFTAALDIIDRRWGSLMGYLQGPLAVTDDDIRVLRERYTY